MSRKFLIVTAVVATMHFPLVTQAADVTTTPATPTTTPTNTMPTEMPKDTWLKTMGPMLPDLICKGFIQDVTLKKRFDEIQMTYEKCVTLIPESTKKCQDQIYSSIPDKINSTSAGTWGKNLGECIGKDFAEKHLIPK